MDRSGVDIAQPENDFAEVEPGFARLVECRNLEIMSFMPRSSDSSAQVISMRCVESEPQGSSEWHSHPFDEFTLVTDGNTVTGHAGEKRKTANGALFFYRPGETHGHWNQKESPRFWVLHFSAENFLKTTSPRLLSSLPRQRFWMLSPRQVDVFRWMFLRILVEHTQQLSGFRQAESAWLQLLLLTVHRWATLKSAPDPQPEITNPELLRLWHLVNDCAGSAESFHERIRHVPNYDSLRHAFRKTFGSSPQKMLMALRLQKAKNLLLESHRSIKEIAFQSGYQRQHEFTRMFRQYVGVSPTTWRNNPSTHMRRL